MATHIPHVVLEPRLERRILGKGRGQVLQAVEVLATALHSHPLCSFVLRRESSNFSSAEERAPDAVPGSSVLLAAPGEVFCFLAGTGGGLFT